MRAAGEYPPHFSLVSNLPRIGETPAAGKLLLNNLPKEKNPL